MRIPFAILAALFSALPAAATFPSVCCFNPSGSYPPEACVVSADVNRDGWVNGADLGVLLGSWGPAPGGSLADFNLDGRVSCFDEKFLLGNWGECVPVDTDLDGDEELDLNDAGILLEAYGTCSHPSPGSCPPELPLDLDNNGRIDANDVAIVNCYLGQPAPALPDVDFDRDGVVDADDRAVVQAAAGRLCPYDLNQNGLVEGTDIKVIIKKGAA